MLRTEFRKSERRELCSKDSERNEKDKLDKGKLKIEILIEILKY